MGKMANTRLKTSMRGNKGRHKADENPLREHGNFLYKSLGEKSVDRPSGQQFVTTEQMEEVLKQAQEVVICGICEKMKAPKHELEPIR